MKIRQVDNATVFKLMQQSFDHGNSFWFVVNGMSMYPFLRQGLDRVEAVPVSDHDLKVGDTVIFVRETGNYVMHRIYRIEGQDFYINGDADKWIEGPVKKAQLKAIVKTIERKGRKISCDNKQLKILVRLWMLLRPMRNSLRRAIKLVERTLTKQV